MKRAKLTVASLLLVSGLSAYGASIDHIQNYTVEYGANPAQQGAINESSSVYFNPAGLSRLHEGTYVTGGVQYAFGEQSIKNSGKKYKANLSSPVPNFSIYKVQEDGDALYWTMGAIGGGASLHYKDGIPVNINSPVINGMLDKLNLTIADILKSDVKGENRYLQTTFGKVWKLNNKWSASAGIRGVYGVRRLEAKAHLDNSKLFNFIKGSASIDSERKALGVGFQLGLNYAPTDRLNIGMRYDSQVNLKFKTDASISDSSIKKLISTELLKKYPVYADGTKERRDLPAILALGASYKVTDRWTTYVGGNYYFNKQARMDRIQSSVKYDNGWELSLGSEYQMTPKWSWLVGGNYADTGAKGDHFSPTEYALDSKMVATGFKYKQNETTEWMVSYTHYFYDTKTYDNSTYKKDIRSVGIGFTKRF
ncbi:OmpP1/FadL family transporter [Cetobacterium sp. SF1]|uniref:OmpP1/FadL family transporter n=1 Tax=Cetobacterium sp. SF1 TaxID=3417654 RepID=UPI003CEE3A8F